MWILSNGTPFAAERTLASDKNGRDVWIVAVKGTFTIKADGTIELAEEQEPVLVMPKHRGDPLKSSLLYESDIDYAKATTDILLHGHAYAPRGRHVSEVEVLMKVGPIQKTLRVVGDRVWKPGVLSLTLTEPKPFLKMPIIYERAFGGTDRRSHDPKKHAWERRNPVGTGFAVAPEHLENQPAPNVEDPKAPTLSWKERPRPAGFGPIARHWSPRVEFAGTYDSRWEEERQPLLPGDFDERFFLCAPEDQQSPGYLRGREPVELHNLTPEGLLRFTLPQVALGFRTLLGDQRIEHRANLHTVILEPDVPHLIMVWQTALPCHGKKLKLNSTTVFLKQIV